MEMRLDPHRLLLRVVEEALVQGGTMTTMTMTRMMLRTIRNNRPERDVDLEVMEGNLETPVTTGMDLTIRLRINLAASYTY